MLNDALAKEVERDVGRREKIGSTAEELAVPQELKDMPIPPDSDLRKRRVVKAATAAASSGSSQMEDSRAVPETPTQQNSRFESTEHQTTNCDENLIGRGQQ